VTLLTHIMQPHSSKRCFGSQPDRHGLKFC
jgi:hypothetical protein